MRGLLRFITILSLLLILSSCVGTHPPIDQSPVDDPVEPPISEPGEVYLRNSAGWKSVFCFLIINKDSGERRTLQMKPDTYGIYYAYIPEGTELIAFGNGEGEQSEPTPPPTAKESTYDNLSGEWMPYSDAIFNSLSIGKNDIRVTPAHKSKGGQYILFHAERDGIYTLVSESAFDFRICVVEYSDGDWSDESADWFAFSPEGDRAELKAGYYYIFLDCSSHSLPEGLHSVIVNYSEPSDSFDPLLGLILSDGETVVCFLVRDECLMSVLKDGVEQALYAYTLIESDRGYEILLTLRSGVEYQVEDYSLSTLSLAGHVYYSYGRLYFYTKSFDILG